MSSKVFFFFLGCLPEDDEDPFDGPLDPQGKSYALSGLKRLAPERFAELVATLSKSTEKVEVMRGCIVSHEPLPEVAKQIGQGEFRF